MQLNRAVNPSSIKNRLAGVAIYSPSSTSALDVTIAPLNTTKSSLVFSVRSGGGVPSMTGVILNSTTLRFKIDSVAAQSLTIEYAVIEYV